VSAPPSYDQVSNSWKSHRREKYLEFLQKFAQVPPPNLASGSAPSPSGAWPVPEVRFTTKLIG